MLTAFRFICNTNGRVEVDVCENRLPNVVHWQGRDTVGALGQDVLEHDWTNLLLYAFPLLTLSWGCYITAYIMLIASFWPKRPWFSLLLMLLPDPPCPLLIGSEMKGSDTAFILHRCGKLNVFMIAILQNNVHKRFIFHYQQYCEFLQNWLFLSWSSLKCIWQHCAPGINFPLGVHKV